MFYLMEINPVDHSVQLKEKDENLNKLFANIK